MKAKICPLKKVSDGKIGQFIESVKREDIISSAHDVLSMTVDDLEPYRAEFILYLTLAMGHLSTGCGLSKKDIEQVLSLSPSTSYRLLNEGLLSPMICQSTPEQGNRHYDGRHHLFSLTAPSQNPNLDEFEKLRIERLEQSIIAILSLSRLFGLFLRHIGRGLEDQRVLDEVLDILAWFSEVLHDSYQRLLNLPSFQVRAGRNHLRVLKVILVMKCLFGNGRRSTLGRFILMEYSKYWQLIPGAQPPEFEGREEVAQLLDVVKQPFISRLKE